MKSRNTSHAFALALFGLLVAPSLAFAQYQGENLKGDYGVNAGTQGPPGLYVIIPFSQQNADRIKDVDGNIAAAGTFGAFDLRYVLPTIYEVTPKKILGGYYGFTVSLPFTKFKLEEPLEPADVSDWGVSDTYVSPITLGWTASRADFIAGYAFNAPTGRYERGAADNLGLGMWSHELQGGTTVFLDSNKRISVATTAFLELHSKKKDQDVKVGNILTLEGGAAYNIEKIGGAFGVGYYLQNKVSDDSGDDVPVLAFRALNLYGRNRVFGIGPDISTGIFEHGQTVGLLNVRYFWESMARSTVEGSTFFLSVTIARMH